MNKEKFLKELKDQLMQGDQSGIYLTDKAKELIEYADNCLLSAKELKNFDRFIEENSNLTLGQLRQKEIELYIKNFKNISSSEEIDLDEDETVDVVFDFPGQFETYTITPTVAAILIDIIKKE